MLEGADVDIVAEIQRVVDTSLTELMDTEEERTAADQLSRQALACPAMIRLAEVVAFIGRGRPATQAGNLKPADAMALAARLGTDQPLPAQVGSIDDLPDTALVFRWAAAAEFLEWRGTRILAAPRAADLERDPLSAWFKAAVTRLEHGLLDGFRQGWRKSYVELLDANTVSLLVGMVEAGGTVALAAIERAAWEHVVSAYGYHWDEHAEHAHVVRLARAMVAQLADLGIVTPSGDQVVLSPLGAAIAAFADLSAESEGDELDLIDTDAQSLLSVCLEEMQPEEAHGHLLAWTQARPGREAAAELCCAMLDDDDPELWALGLEALAMLDPAVVVPAVRGLRSRPGLDPLIADWLGRHGTSARGSRPR